MHPPTVQQYEDVDQGQRWIEDRVLLKHVLGGRVLSMCGVRGGSSNHVEPLGKVGSPVIRPVGLGRTRATIEIASQCRAEADYLTSCM